MQSQSEGPDRGNGLTPDLGNSHILDYRLYQSLKDWPWRGRRQSPEDFDIATERREGWGYV